MNDDRISEAYKGEIWQGPAQDRARRRINWMCSQAVGERVLDLGCSQGIASIVLGREGFHVIGVDVQPSRIEYAKEDLAQESAQTRERVEFMVGEGSGLPFEDESFDTILLGEVIEHLAVPDRILRESQRLLRSGGRLVITTPFGVLHHHDHKQTFYPDDVLELIGSRFDIASVDIADRYFRIVAGSSLPDAMEMVKAFRRLNEAATATVKGIQEELAETRVRALRQDTEIDKLNTRLAEASKDAGERKAKITDLERSVNQLTGRLNDKTAALSKATTDLGRTKAELEKALARSEGLVGDIRSLRESLNKSQHAASVSSRQAEATAQHNRILEKQVAKLEHDRWKLRNDLGNTRWKLESLRQRKWWRLARVLGEVRRRPWRILIAPFDIVSVAFSRSQLPERPQPTARPRANTTPTATRKTKPKGSSGSTSLELPEVVEPAPIPRRLIPVATLLDPPHARRFEHEWQMSQVTRSNWRDVLTRDRPMLLFVESADGGRDGTWRGMLDSTTGLGIDFIEMVTTFRQSGVPTVFWATNDPDQYASHLETARLFDYVFTVSANSVDKYRTDLGHDRIALLPFSAQPKIHNPIQVGERSRKVLFVQSEPRNMPTDGLDGLLQEARRLGLEVYAEADTSAPSTSTTLDGGAHRTLDDRELTVASKLFQTAIAPLSAVGETSPRRSVFELAATNTPMVGAIDAAVAALFDSSVLQVDSEKEARTAIRTLLGSEDLRTRAAHRALRTVMRSHTTGHRVDTVLDHVGVDYPATTSPTVSIVVPTNRPGNLDNIIDNVGRQTYPNIELVLALHGIDLDEGATREHAAESGLEDLKFLRVDSDVILGDVFNHGFATARGDFIAKMDDDDYYGAEYLADLVDAFSYTEADIVGKWAHYAYLEGLDTMILRYGKHEHSYQDVLAISTLLMKREVFDSVKFPAMPVGSGSVFLRAAGAEGARIYSGDRFNYLYVRYADQKHNTFPVSELHLAGNSQTVCQGRNLDQIVV